MPGSGPIIYVDHSEVREGKLQLLKPAMRELAEFVRTNEPRIISYNVYFDDDGKHMTVVHLHHDSDSLEFHMKKAGPEFPRFADFVNLDSIDIYGQVPEVLLDQLRRKAKMLGGGTVAVHEHHAGFSRVNVDT